MGKVKQTYTTYVISCYTRLKTRFKFNYASCRANIYEYYYLERVKFPAPILTQIFFRSTNQK
jgi:hypothetical protein